ncbi:MAG: hypothetical protein K2X48_06235 [Chitinophagaceae bacterium]|nr:hypothetical protein [Chitinophagaceae bacterium]
MYYELSKGEKKIARMLIDKGLDAAYVKALEDAATIIEKWRSKKPDNKESYLELYKVLDMHDNAIANRYNNLGGSRWLATVVDLFVEKIITEEDIQGFSETTRNIIYDWGGLRKNNNN